MSSCLVQQLFRQKVGGNLDPDIVDEVLFPMLRSRKHPAKELLIDIKMTSGVFIRLDDTGREEQRFNVPTFTQIPEYWTRRPYPLRGGRPSNVLRHYVRQNAWGSIEILNELRGLNYPQMGHRPMEEDEDDGVNPSVDRRHTWIGLKEDCSLPSNIRVDNSHHNRFLIESRLLFLNKFLEDIIVSGQPLAWDTLGGRSDGMIGTV